jgi:hypothetical protein
LVSISDHIVQLIPFCKPNKVAIGWAGILTLKGEFMKKGITLTVLAFLLLNSLQTFALDCNESHAIQSEKMNFYIANQGRLEKSLRAEAQKYCYRYGLGLNLPVQLTETLYKNSFEDIQLIQAEACFSCVEQTSVTNPSGPHECRPGELPQCHDFNPEHCSCVYTGY